MQHTESSIKVFFTREYSLFRMVEGNRELNSPKIKHILNDIDNGIDVLRFCPIMVVENNDRLDIVDGQHRFYVARKIKSPVWYIIAEKFSMYEVARINSNTSRWKGQDFINCYTQLENEDYKILNDFLIKYPIPISTAVHLLQNSKVIDGGGDAHFFEKGKFKIKDLEYASKIMETCKQFNFSNNLKRPFIRSIHKICSAGKIDVAELIRKAENEMQALEFAIGEKAYLIALENIYNKGKQNRVVIY